HPDQLEIADEAIIATAIVGLDEAQRLLEARQDGPGITFDRSDPKPIDAQAGRKAQTEAGEKLQAAIARKFCTIFHGDPKGSAAASRDGRPAAACRHRDTPGR